MLSAVAGELIQENLWVNVEMEKERIFSMNAQVQSLNFLKGKELADDLEFVQKSECHNLEKVFKFVVSQFVLF